MTRADALRDLLSKVEAGEWFPGLAQRAIGGVQNYYYASNAFHGSLDAAKALHDAVLPGWFWRVTQRGCAVFIVDDIDAPSFLCNGDDPARAWLIAILEALIAAEDN